MGTGENAGDRQAWSRLLKLSISQVSSSNRIPSRHKSPSAEHSKQQEELGWDTGAECVLTTSATSHAEPDLLSA